MDYLERRSTNHPIPGSETAWFAFRERTKAIIHTEVDAWLQRILGKPTDGEARIEVNLDELTQRLLNHILPFEDFKEEWLKARKDRGLK